MSDTAMIIQARTGSTRLPNKMILPFWQDKSLFEVVILRLKQLHEKMILATTEIDSDDRLCQIAGKYDIDVYRGSEENVLSRFIGAAEKYSIDKIIRICADNPFLDIASLKILIEKAKLTNNFDYITYSVNQKPTILTHYGFWAEATRLETLKRISKLTSAKVHIEHLTNYIYTHPQDFIIEYLKVGEAVTAREDIRLTLDTRTDFDTQKKLFSKVIEKYDWSFNIPDVIDTLDEHPEMIGLMKNEIERNEK